jgi:FKBP-type peptidyl-prolyl cis-trans isomerase SlyD
MHDPHQPPSPIAPGAIAPGQVAAIAFTLRNADGETLGEVSADEPVEYLHGRGNIVAGLERALAGSRAGDELVVRVAPEDGYGDVDPTKVQSVPREEFPPDVELEVGMQFGAEDEHGGEAVIWVKSIAADGTVTVDGNHPLAGQTLEYRVRVLGVRAATREELAHGHVHGPHGHHH